MAKLDYVKHLFPWRTGNSFGLHLNGVSFYPAMLSAIGDARDFILLEMYLVESGRVTSCFIDSLLAAVTREIKVYVVFDAYGSHGLNKQDRRRLQNGGVCLVFFNTLRYRQALRYLFRDHRKLLVIDGQVAFVGGAGLTDDFVPQDDSIYGWRETMLEIRGPIVDDWAITFSQTWQQQTHAELELSTTPAIISGNQKGRVAVSPYYGQREIRRALVNNIRRAQNRIWIATAYFVPSRKIRRALRFAAARGVDVRLILPGPHIDLPAVRYIAHRFYLRLLINGVRIFEYQPCFLHQKVALCDNWVSIGSANLDRWNFHWNLEANQEIENETMAREVVQMFQQDMKLCDEIKLKQWRQRNQWGRILEWFWGQVDRRLARIHVKEPRSPD